MFNDIKLCGLSNAKPNLVEKQMWFYLIHIWWDKRVHIFPEAIWLQTKVIALREIKCAYYDVAVQHVNHCAMQTLSAVSGGWLLCVPIFPSAIFCSRVFVLYWPTTRSGCKNRKCTYVNNWCIRSRNIRIITLTVDGLNECSLTPTRRTWRWTII